MGDIPKHSTDCSYCIAPEAFGDPKGRLCQHHRGKDGKPVEYAGSDAYEPSAWVKQVVGNHYRAWDGRIYLVFGYDPRSGFWVRTVDNDEPRHANISERAIGRTYHRLRNDEVRQFT